jgi:hypothetical protein
MPKILIRPRDGLSVYVLNDDTNGLLSSYANGYAKAGRDACVADAINYSDAETYFDEVARFSIVGKMDQCGSLATTGHPVVCRRRNRLRDSCSAIQNHEERRWDQ